MIKSFNILSLWTEQDKKIIVRLRLENGYRPHSHDFLTLGVGEGVLVNPAEVLFQGDGHYRLTYSTNYDTSPQGFVISDIVSPDGLPVSPHVLTTDYRHPMFMNMFLPPVEPEQKKIWFRYPLYENPQLQDRVHDPESGLEAVKHCTTNSYGTNDDRYSREVADRQHPHQTECTVNWWESYLATLYKKPCQIVSIRAKVSRWSTPTTSHTIEFVHV